MPTELRDIGLLNRFVGIAVKLCTYRRLRATCENLGTPRIALNSDRKSIMNFEDYETLPTNSVATNMSAGAIAGVMEHCVMYPMDSVKVILECFKSVFVS